MKRSTTATLVLMGLTPLFLTACDDDSKQVSQQNFTSVDACTQAGVPQATCQKAYDDAQANAEKSEPHFKTYQDCVAQYGADMCRQGTSATEGSFWGPLMTGFLISRMLGGGSAMYYPAGPIFRQSSGSYYSPTGGVFGGSYSSGSSGWRTASASGDGSAGGSRAITASRGGFGSASAAAGSWGG
jgi:uncharacterized protein YgiB involved in biofilm formation